MSYIIVATFSEDRQRGFPRAAAKLLKVPEIRLLRRDAENELVSLDMRGDFDRKAELTREFCGHLIDAGVVEFDIHHSY